MSPSLYAWKPDESDVISHNHRFMWTNSLKRILKHYKKTCIWPLTSCHVYEAHTRGKLFATCSRRGRSGCCEMYNLTRVHLYTCPLCHVSNNTCCDKLATCIKYTCPSVSRVYLIHVADIPWGHWSTWPTAGNFFYFFLNKKVSQNPFHLKISQEY